MPLEHILVASAAAGGLGGWLADTAMHGLDTIKTRMQGQLTSPHSSKYISITQSSLLILREEGLRGLYGGYLAAAVGSFLSTTAHFAVYESIKTSLRNNPHIGATLPEPSIFFISGAAGDLVSSIFYVPSELLKTRLQLQGRYGNPYSLSAHNYKNTTHAVRSVYTKYGIPGFYRGWAATLLRDMPFTAFQFSFYETFKSILSSSHTAEYPNLDNNSSLSLLYYPLNYVRSKNPELVPGCLAGMLAGAITTPLDVIKTFLQTQSKPKPEKFISSSGPLSSSSSLYPHNHRHHQVYHTTLRSVARHIYSTQGWTGFMQGLVPRILWTGSQSMIMFVLYEHFLTLFHP